MIEKPWYKRWWGALLIFFALVTLVNVSTQRSQKENQASTTQTPQTQQAPKKTDSQHLTEIETRFNEYQTKLKEYYPDDDMLRTLSADTIKLTLLEAGYAKPQDEIEKRILLRVKTLRPKIEILRRDVYAKTLERATLDKGFSTEVQATGASKQVLEYKYALMSKALVYKLTGEGKVLETAKNAGFTKLIFTDGFNNSWTYDLRKQN